MMPPGRSGSRSAGETAAGEAEEGTDHPVVPGKHTGWLSYKVAAEGDSEPECSPLFDVKRKKEREGWPLTRSAHESGGWDYR